LSDATIMRVHRRDEAVDLVREAAARGATLALQGGASKRGWGNAMSATWTADLRGIAGVVTYEPEELVLTVRPGTTLAELDDLLAARGQSLAFEPPDFGPLWDAPAAVGTIGGAVACNASGPRRLRAGAARDHVLGVEFVNGRAEAIRSGGRVVKNVTGYDLCKLLAGSFGTLGLLTEITLRVVPRAARTETLVVRDLEVDTAARVMGELLSGPASPSGLAYLPAIAGAPGARLCVRFEGGHAGAGERSRAAVQRYGGEILGSAGSRELWKEIADVSPFRGAGALWRLAIPPASLPEVADALGAERCQWLADWGGSLVWIRTEADDDRAALVRVLAARVGGRATLFRALPGSATPVWPPRPPALAALDARVKAGFDPLGLFNPGRLDG
jgi:glycolate oxidase FAD binding subunit